MNDLFDPLDMEWWFINNQPMSKKSKNHMKHTLYYCEACEKVWEILFTGTVARYRHLPTYGLRRKECRYCQSGKNTTYKQRKNAAHKRSVK